MRLFRAPVITGRSIYFHWPSIAVSHGLRHPPFLISSVFAWLVAPFMAKSPRHISGPYPRPIYPFAPPFRVASPSLGETRLAYHL